MQRGIDTQFLQQLDSKRGETSSTGDGLSGVHCKMQVGTWMRVTLVVRSLRLDGALQGKDGGLQGEHGALQEKDGELQGEHGELQRKGELLQHGKVVLVWVVLVWAVEAGRLHTELARRSTNRATGEASHFCLNQREVTARMSLVGCLVLVFVVDVVSV